jgi:phosphorylase kinase alpha/beta subunit
VYQVRQLSGCLIRVPNNFYEDIWNILKKTPGGIYMNDQHLPQEPTLSKMSRYQSLNFSLPPRDEI